MDKEREAQAWLAFASAALAGYTPDDDLDNFDDLIEDMVEVATAAADNMVSEFEARYGTRSRRAASPPAPKRGGRRRAAAADDDDQE